MSPNNRAKTDGSGILSQLARLEELEESVVDSAAQEDEELGHCSQPTDSCLPSFARAPKREPKPSLSDRASTMDGNSTGTATVRPKRQMSTREKCFWFLGAIVIAMAGGGAIAALLIYNGTVSL
jgi:hypothetical protein